MALSISKFKVICRICLKEEQFLTSLYEDPNVNKMLKSCTSVQFNKNEGLPNKICTTCFGELLQAYNFRSKCEMSDSMLRKYLIRYHRSTLSKLEEEDEEDTVIVVDEDDTELTQQKHDNSLNIKISNVIGSYGETEEVETQQTDKNLEEITINNKVNTPVSVKKQIVDNNKKNNKRKRDESSASKLLLMTNNDIQLNSEENIAPNTSNCSDLNTFDVGTTETKCYSCEICPTVFKRLSALKNHLQLHTELINAKNDIPNNHECDICFEVFPNTVQLMNHKKIHRKRSYVRHKNLKIHKNIHLVENSINI